MTGWLYVRTAGTGPVFALDISAGGICTLAPPVARWCLGRASGQLIRYWRGRGATVTAFVDS